MFCRAFVSVAMVLAFGASVSAGLQEMGTPVVITPLVKTTGPRSSFTSNSGITDPVRLVIKDQKTWRAIWKRVNSPGLNSPPPPAINFSKEMLIVVALGQRSTGGYSIVVDKAYEVGHKVQIEVVSISPGKGCMLTQALTEPVDIVRIPKTTLPVSFKETQRVHDCE